MFDTISISFQIHVLYCLIYIDTKFCKNVNLFLRLTFSKNIQNKFVIENYIEGILMHWLSILLFRNIYYKPALIFSLWPRKTFCGHNENNDLLQSKLEIIIELFFMFRLAGRQPYTIIKVRVDWIKRKVNHYCSIVWPTEI